MSFRRAPLDLLPAGAQTVAASATNEELGRAFGVTNGRVLRVDLVHEEATVVTGVTLKLQVMVGLDAAGDEVWKDSKTATVTNSTTSTTLTLQPEVAGDQGFLPLPGKARLVVTSGVGDELEVVSALVFQ